MLAQALGDASNKIKWAISLLPALENMSVAQLSILHLYQTLIDWCVRIMWPLWPKNTINHWLFLFIKYIIIFIIPKIWTLVLCILRPDNYRAALQTDFDEKKAALEAWFRFLKMCDCINETVLFFATFCIWDYFLHLLSHHFGIYNICHNPCI
jgi:hypothetical protein